MSSIESIIITNTVRNENYFRKILPFLKLEYFENKDIKIIIKNVIEYFNQFNELPPTSTTLSVLISKNKKLNEETIKNINDTISILYSDNIEIKEALNQNLKWLIDQTEEFYQQKSVYNALLKAVEIVEKNGNNEISGLPQIFQDALKVDFDLSIGHNYFQDSQERFESYKNVEEKIPTGLKLLDDCTDGGFETKTLQVWLGGTGTGKTQVLCHQASNAIKSGYDVVYFTMEMSEKKIAMRIDANLLDVNINDLKYIDNENLNGRLESLKQKTHGKLIIKEYPTGAPSANTFRAFLDELYQKTKIKPKIVIFDYINLCRSSRAKANANSYETIKCISEELRGLAVEYEFCGITGTQTNRDGQGASDIDLTNTSESFGLPATADFMGAIIYNDELKQKSQMVIKILKTRYGDNVGFCFTVGRDNSHMRLFDLEMQNNEAIPATPITKMVAKPKQTITTFNFT